MRKRFMSFALVFLFVSFCLVSSASSRTIAYSDTTSGGVGTSEVLDTLSYWNIKDAYYVGAVFEYTPASGGGSGAGYVKFQGSMDASTWVDLPIVELSDSCEVTTTLAFSGTSTALYACALTVAPVNWKAQTSVQESSDPSYLLGNILPFTWVRAIVSDTNLNALFAGELTLVIKKP